MIDSRCFVDSEKSDVAPYLARGAAVGAAAGAAAPSSGSSTCSYSLAGFLGIMSYWPLRAGGTRSRASSESASRCVVSGVDSFAAVEVAKPPSLSAWSCWSAPLDDFVFFLAFPSTAVAAAARCASTAASSASSSSSRPGSSSLSPFARCRRLPVEGEVDVPGKDEPDRGGDAVDPRLVLLVEVTGSGSLLMEPNSWLGCTSRTPDRSGRVTPVRTSFLVRTKSRHPRTCTMPRTRRAVVMRAISMVRSCVCEGSRPRGGRPQSAYEARQPSAKERPGTSLHASGTTAPLQGKQFRVGDASRSN
mmetsp:Transcript_2611/g.8364  ORF Transcript_2611/g.8364 Transcript_2611/m.8364 type:complete len:304 (+) Transcript_2611:1214-2125(+)